VCEGARSVMAGAAGNATVRRQAAIEEQSLAERNLLGGLRVVGGYHCPSGVHGRADLSKRLRPSEWTWFGNRRRLQHLLWRRSENRRPSAYDRHECEPDSHATPRAAAALMSHEQVVHAMAGPLLVFFCCAVFPGAPEVENRRRSGLEESQQVLVDLVLPRRAHAVRRSLVYLQRRVLDDLRRQQRRSADGHDLVVVAMEDERWHV